jgi:hypothetical protein
MDDDVSSAVKGYARNLPEVLGAVSLDPIRPYATPDLVDRTRLYVVMITEERQQMIQARLLSQDIVSTAVEGDTATAVASEQWSLVYTDRSTGEVVSREDYSAEVEYRLVQVEGQWYVNEVITE